MWKLQLALILLFVRILFLLLIEDMIVMQVAVMFGITVSTIIVVAAFGLIFWFMVQGGVKGKKKAAKKFHIRDVLGIFGVILAGIMIISEFGITTATNILHNNPILFYCILVPFIIGSLAQWINHRLM